MSYTKEQLMPKRGTPNRYGYYMTFYSQLGEWLSYPYFGKMSDAYWKTHIDYYINIPGELGAPDEVKPLAYPENKPNKNGSYIIHDKNNDCWSAEHYSVYWSGFRGWRQSNIDYFIDIPLESEDDMSEKFEHWDNGTIRVDKVSPTLINIGWVSGCERLCGFSVEEFTDVAIKILESEGYDVTKRQHEIAPCPNPECRGAVNVIQTGEYSWYCECDNCQYGSSMANTESEAIRLHNLIAGR